MQPSRRGDMDRYNRKLAAQAMPPFDRCKGGRSKRLDAWLRLGHERGMITGGLESVGEAMTGGLAARAVEPAAGEGTGEGGGACLNCGTPLVGPHCHQCGQAGHVHRTLGAFWHDLAHSVLHFDGKMWRTLPLLAWRPGELTRRYVAGERARFVSPMALFLFSVFLMFAVFSSIGGPFGGGSSSDQTPAQEQAEARREYVQERSEGLQELKEARAERAQRAAEKRSTATADGRIRRLEANLALKERLFNQAMALVDAQEKEAIDKARAEQAKAVAGPARKAAEQADKGDLVVLTGADSLNAWFNHALKKAKENPSLLVYKLQTNAYKFSWALIPISVPFVWLLFLHRRPYRRYRAYDHTVFVTYSIAFMSLGVIALSVLRMLGSPEVVAGLAMMFVPPLHIYRQLRGAYELSRWSALWRTVALINFAFVAAGLFFTLLLALGLLG
jgi:ABC-type multidrug transport system fused ATPase/permease subunit